MAHLPKHTIQRRDLLNYNGNITNHGVLVRSGTLSDVVADTTGSVTIKYDAHALKIKRVEIFHSGASSTFHATIENSTPNTLTDYDPRNIVVEYSDVAGSVDYTAGIDQVENLFAMTDLSSELKSGNLYLKCKPFAAAGSLNSFKYLIFCEASFIYVDKDGNRN